MAISILDTNVLIYLFENSKKEDFYKILDYLTLRFHAVWIPKTVIKEYTKGNGKILPKIIAYSSLISECPITISKNDIHLIYKPGEVDEGEADGILQADKGQFYRKYSSRTDDFVFISHDGPALKFADNFGVSVFPFSRLREELRETGIEI